MLAGGGVRYRINTGQLRMITVFRNVLVSYTVHTYVHILYYRVR